MPFSMNHTRQLCRNMAPADTAKNIRLEIHRLGHGNQFRHFFSGRRTDCPLPTDTTAVSSSGTVSAGLWNLKNPLPVWRECR